MHRKLHKPEPHGHNETATPERREHIDELLDEMEYAAGEWWLLQRDIERFRALGGDVDLYPAGR